MTELQARLMEDIKHYMKGMVNVGENFYDALYQACEINFMTEEVVEEGYWDGSPFYQECTNIHKVIHEDGFTFYLAVLYSRERERESCIPPWEYRMESYWIVKPVTTTKWESVE